MRQDRLELFSAYLDDQATPEERKQVEQQISRDPEARAVLDDLRAFFTTLDASAPAAITAPPEFRQSIMRRLKGPGGSGSASGSDKPPTVPRHWLISGVVLFGLVGTLVGVDHAQKKHDLPTPSKPSADLTEFAPEQNHSRPRLAHGQTGSTANPADIQNLDRGAVTHIAGQTVLQGDVLSIGHGRAQTMPGVASGARFDLPKNTSSVWPVVESSRPARPQLDSAMGWTPERIGRYCQAHPVKASRRPDDWLAIAQRQQINPGLLLAAAQSPGFTDLEEAARRIRSILNAQYGKNETERLQALALAFEEPAQAWRRWQQALD